MTNLYGDSDDPTMEKLKEFKEQMKRIYRMVQSTPPYDIREEIPESVLAKLEEYESAISTIANLCDVLYSDFKDVELH